jgi:hypothetical protein
MGNIPMGSSMNPLKNWQRDNYYKELVYQGEAEDKSDHTAPRLVILVRDDILPPIHQGIQAMHSVIMLASVTTGKIDPRCYLILLGVQDEKEMDRLRRKAVAKVHKASMAYSDPGLVDPETGESPVTACAFEPMTNEELKRVFGGLKRAE